MTDLVIRPATADDAETILRAALHAEVDGELLHT